MEERRNGVSVSYAYDKAGNRIKKTDTQGVTLYQFNRKNQLITEENSVDIKQFTYDRQGGIVKEKNSEGIRHFAYNSRHQQTKVETENGNVQENRYDVRNLRFELLENGKRTSFAYHNRELLHEEGREEQKTSYHLGMGIDAFQRGQELSYYHRDEQLNMALITGAQGGIQNNYQYDAFGVQLEEKEQFHNRIRYTGQQYDELTEQYYLRARYYNPVLGRFMQEDVYQGDGLNLYAYCGNNPVVYYDPSGYDRRYDFMGATLRLNSPGGRRVLDNMLREGYLDISKISDQDILNTIWRDGFEGGKVKITGKLKDEIEFFSFAEGGYHPLAEGNMSHIRNAVDAWNEEYYQYGARSEQVRTFMNNSDNYYIETAHANKSEGATLGNYRDPEPPKDQEMATPTCKQNK